MKMIDVIENTNSPKLKPIHILIPITALLFLLTFVVPAFAVNSGIGGDVTPSASIGHDGDSLTYTWSVSTPTGDAPLVSTGSAPNPTFTFPNGQTCKNGGTGTLSDCTFIVLGSSTGDSCALNTNFAMEAGQHCDYGVVHLSNTANSFAYTISASDETTIASSCSLGGGYTATPCKGVVAQATDTLQACQSGFSFSGGVAGCTGIQVPQTMTVTGPTIVIHPAIDVVKSVNPTKVDVTNGPATITVTATVTNTGDTTLSGVTAIDSLAGTLSCSGLGVSPSNSLDPGASAVCTGTYVIAQGTSDKTSVDTVTAGGVDVLGLLVTAQDQATVNIIHPAISVVKGTSGKVEPGATITVTATVTNTGDTTLSGIVVIDDHAGTLNCGGQTSLASLASMVCTGTFSAPATPGVLSVTNTVTVSGQDQIPVTVSASASATTNIISPDISVVKGTSGKVEAGATINVTATVTNTGNTGLSGILVVDDHAGTLSCGGQTSLAAGAFMVCTGSFTAPTSPSILSVTNTVTASGADQTPTTVSDSASASTTIIHPSIGVTKATNGKVEAGATITVTATVTNTGDTSLSGIVAVDDHAGTLSCGVTTLAAGASTACTGSFQASTTPGVLSVTNTVTVSGHDQTPVTVSNTASATTTIIHPNISVTKATNAKVEVGSTITVSATVTNTGDTGLTGVTAIDDHAGTLSCPGSTLAAGASMLCTGSFSALAGYGSSVRNTVTVSGQDQTPTTVSASASATTTILHPDISVTKATSGKVEAGATISVTATVTNSGNTSLSGIIAVDDHAATLSCGVTTLAAGASTTCTGSFIAPTDPLITSVTNTVTVSGADQTPTTVSDSASASTTIIHPSIQVTKATSGKVEMGATISVTATVTNTGDTTLNGITAVDDHAGTLNCGGQTSLTAGASMVCTGSFPGPTNPSILSVTNTVTVSGQDQTPVTVTAAASASTTIIHPSIGVTKSTNAKIENGATLSVTATVTNTGDTNLGSIIAVDSEVGTLTCAIGSGTLVPAASTVCTGSAIYTGVAEVTVTNTVTVSGTDQTPVTVTATATASTIILHPDISVTKATSGKVEAGSTISVTATVTNSGDTGLSGIVAIDDHAGTLSCPGSTLGPGAQMACTGSFTAPTSLSILSVTNTVTVSGHDQTPVTVTDSASASTSIIHPSIDVTKATNGKVEVGSTISVSATVTNSGDVTLNSITAVDDHAGTLSCPSNSLAAGASMLCTGSFPALAGYGSSVTNTVTVSGTDQTPTTVTDSASASTTIIHPGISVTKATSGKAEVGSTISVMATVTNTGDTGLSGIVALDTQAGTLTCPGGSLAAGASMLCTGSFIAPNALSVTNTVTVSGQDQTPVTVSASDHATTQVIQVGVTVTIDCTVTGSTITFFGTVTNTGTTSETVSGTVSGATTGTFGPSVLAAGASLPFTFAVTVSPGTYTCTASVSATDQTGATATGSASSTCTISGGITRTLGYWATHLQFTSYVFTNDLGGQITFGSCVTLSGVDDVMGGFWSSVSFTTTHNHRTPLDQARMILAQQLLAAILNNAAFGSTPSGVTLAQAGIDYCGTNAATILNDANLLNTFNNSGDTLTIPPSTPGSQYVNISQPTTAKSVADYVDWDTPGSINS